MAVIGSVGNAGGEAIDMMGGRGGGLTVVKARLFLLRYCWLTT